MSAPRLEIGLGAGGNMLVYLPGPAGQERTITLPMGKEAELLFTMLHAQTQSDTRIESEAAPTQTLAFHIAKHSEANARGFFTETCAHCRAEREQRKAAKVVRKEKKQKDRSFSELQKLLTGLPADEVQKLLEAYNMKGESEDA